MTNLLWGHLREVERLTFAPEVMRAALNPPRYYTGIIGFPALMRYGLDGMEVHELRASAQELESEYARLRFRRVYSE